MTPRTRSTNKEANFKVYYSKKVPQQKHFPHRRKTVRRPLAVAKDGSDKKQMKFLPEKMRIRKDVMDSEEEDNGEELEEGGIAIGSETEDKEAEQERIGKKPRGRGEKRRREAVEVDSEEDEEPVKPTPKRRRQSTAPRSNRRSRQVKAESESEDNATPSHTKQKVDRSRTLRRQSTMTQLVEGRRPVSDTEEPAFKSVKRSSRLSWGGKSKKAKDKKQRTLTQMIPGMKPLEIVSDDDMEQGLSDKEADERDSQAYGEAIAARLAQEGLIQEKSDDAEPVHDLSQSVLQQNNEEGDQGDLLVRALDTPSLMIHSVEDTDEEEESYQPTQFIDAPVTRTRRSPRQSFARKPQEPQAAEAPSTGTRRAAKSKFGLLSTPEKRRIREIPSSQSPPDSPLSTQVSPSKAPRAPLQERSGNTIQLAETPSKHKQVTFQMPAKEPVPPPALRKFRSTIQDSEDEEDDLIEEDNDRSAHREVSTPALIQNTDNMAHGRDVGNETQAMLDQIDQSCAPVHEDAEEHSRESSKELGMSVFDQDRGSSEELGMSIFDRDRESSPELGDLLQQRTAPRAEDIPESYPASHTGVKQEPLHDDDTPNLVQEPSREEKVHSPYRMAHPGVKQEQSHPHANLEEESLSAPSDEPASTIVELPVTTQVPSSPPMIEQLPEETCPSTPLVIMDSSDEEDEEPDSTPPKSTHTITQTSSNTIQQSADLDGEPIQVPRSPTIQQESQKSHSSKAEQQLQNEWFSYSQYFNGRPDHTSSMNVTQDKFSYDATPRPPRPAAPAHCMSQATTVDEVTPRKNRTQRTISANTTPHKIASSQPLSSPSKPPPLFIPSSFPSPTKARMDEWSSPVYGRTQDTGYNLASLEDFSIPLPPPMDIDDD